jgi:hypothetical protein
MTRGIIFDLDAALVRVEFVVTPSWQAFAHVRLTIYGSMHSDPAVPSWVK